MNFQMSIVVNLPEYGRLVAAPNTASVNWELEGAPVFVFVHKPRGFIVIRRVTPPREEVAEFTFKLAVQSASMNPWKAAWVRV